MNISSCMEENKKEAEITQHSSFFFNNCFTSPVLILLLSEKRSKSPSMILSDMFNSFWRDQLVVEILLSVIVQLRQ